MKQKTSKSDSELVIYQTEDGRTRVEVRLENESVWLTQAQMAELFQTTKQNISLHIQNVFDEGELPRAATVKDSLTVQPVAAVKEFLTTRQEGSRQVSRLVEYYNLDVIISVGYRVKSLRGTQFRIWATQRLREHFDFLAQTTQNQIQRDHRDQHFNPARRRRTQNRRCPGNLCFRLRCQRDG
jgi:hypothetical protein